MGRLEVAGERVREQIALGNQQAHNFVEKIRRNRTNLLAFGLPLVLGIGLSIAGVAYATQAGQTERNRELIQSVEVHGDVPGAGSYDITNLDEKIIRVTLTDKGTGINPNFRPLRDESLKLVSKYCSPLDFIAFTSRNFGTQEDYYAQPREESARKCVMMIANPPSTPTPTS